MHEFAARMPENRCNSKFSLPPLTSVIIVSEGEPENIVLIDCTSRTRASNGPSKFLWRWQDALWREIMCLLQPAPATLNPCHPEVPFATAHDPCHPKSLCHTCLSAIFKSYCRIIYIGAQSFVLLPSLHHCFGGKPCPCLAYIHV
jgi:hypothetical protein